MPSRRRRQSLLVSCCLFAVLVAVASGCVRRRMTIVSNPPGAMCYVDNYEIGITPCSTDFTYYGVREFKLVKAGYETLTFQKKISPPWYEYPVIEFFSENVVPGEIRDEQVVSATLQPQMVVPTDQILQRADNLRRGVQNQAAAAIGAPPPPESSLAPTPSSLPVNGLIVPEIVPTPQPQNLLPAPGIAFPPSASAPGVLPPPAGPTLLGPTTVSPPGTQGLVAPPETHSLVEPPMPAAQPQFIPPQGPSTAPGFAPSSAPSQENPLFAPPRG